MKIKSSMFYKKKSFSMIHIPLWSEKKNLIKYLSELPPAGQKLLCSWKTSNFYWSMVGTFYIAQKITKNISSAFGTV